MAETWVCLIKIKGEGGLRSHVIDKPAFTIGRTQEADLPLVDVSVSRIHLSVQVKSDGVAITDNKSANGTVLNGKPMTQGTSYAILPGDTVKLGNAAEEFSFQAIPKPFELSSIDEQRNALMASMSTLTKEIDGRARKAVEDEMRQARLELEQVKANSKLEVETFKAQAAAELAARKAALDDELGKQRKEAASFLESERLRARKEADALAAEALVKIQKDYEKASASIETQMKNAHAKSLEIVSEADKKATVMVSEAREEASRVRLGASEESRVMQQELLRKTTEGERGLHERLQREMVAKRAELEAQLRAESDKERERVARELASQKEAAQVQLHSLEERRKVLQSDLERIERERSKSDMDYESLQGELAVAKKLIAETEELQNKKMRVTNELRELERTRESGAAALEKQMTEAREAALLNFEEKKRDLENEMAKRRLSALAEIEILVQAEEKRYEQTRKMRALEITEKLHDKLIPKLDRWVADPASASARMKTEVDAVVTQVLVTGASTIQAVTGVASAPVTARQERRDKRIQKYIFAVGGMVCAALAVYHNEVLTFLREGQKDSYAAKLIERRRIQSVYSPAQTDDYRDSYGDNVLYMRGYYETKTEADFLEKWTLKLNDLAFLRSMGLGEENIVQFISKETNLVHRLGALRSQIDAVYLSEGLERMRKAEAEDIAEIEKAVKGAANLKKIRGAEREFLRDYLAKNRK